MLSAKEVERIESFFKKKFGNVSGAFKEVNAGSESYFVFAERKSNRCFFLGPDNKCVIQDVKPLDCVAYPVRAVYSECNNVEFIIDSSCPASVGLSEGFVKEAKSLALRSLKRFSRKAYLHWFDNYLVSKK